MEERTWRRWWDVCADVLYWLPAFYLTSRFLRSSLFLDVFDVNSCISSLAQYQHAKFPSPATFRCQPSPPSQITPDAHLTAYTSAARVSSRTPRRLALELHPRQMFPGALRMWKPPPFPSLAPPELGELRSPPKGRGAAGARPLGAANDRRAAAPGQRPWAARGARGPGATSASGSSSSCCWRRPQVPRNLSAP